MVKKITKLVMVSAISLSISCFAADDAQQKQFSEQELKIIEAINALNLKDIPNAEYTKEMNSITAHVEQNRISLKNLINATSSPTLLQGDVIGGNKEMVDYMLSIGVDPQPAWNSIFRMNTWSINIIAALLKHGANINAQISDGRTQLFSIVASRADTGSYQVIEFLLEHGANPNMPDSEGATPLMALMGNHNASDKHIEGVLILLLNNDADIQIKSNEGFTVFDYARKNNHFEILHKVLRQYTALYANIPPIIDENTPLPPEIGETITDYLFFVPKTAYSPYRQYILDVKKRMKLFLQNNDQQPIKIRNASLNAYNELITIEKKDKELQEAVRKNAPKEAQNILIKEIDALLDNYNALVQTLNAELDKADKASATDKKILPLDEE